MNPQRRIFEAPEPVYPQAMSCSADIAKLFGDYGKAELEHFIMVFFNARLQIVGHEVMSVGCFNQGAVYIKQVVRSAVLAGVSSVAFVHNHPAGSFEPSTEDKRLTKHLVFALYASDFQCLDHIIVTRSGYYSFADNSLIRQYEEQAKRVMGF